MSEINEKFNEYVNSPVGQAVLTLGAYTIKSTKTTKDNEIVDNVDEIVNQLADALSKLNATEVTTDEAKAAVMVILKTIAEATPTKWDDRLIPIVDLFLQPTTI